MKGRNAARIKKDQAGMTLVEVVAAFTVLVLLFAAYAAFLYGASALNREAQLQEAGLAAANGMLQGAAAGCDSTDSELTFMDGGTSYSVNIRTYRATVNDVTLERFIPR